MKKKILQVAPDLSVKGGISSVLKMYLKTDLPHKYHFDFVTTHVDGAKIRKFIAMIYGIFKFVFVLSTQSIAIVHIHCGDIPSPYRKLFFLKISQWFKRPTILHLHGALFLKQYQKASVFWKKQLKYLFEQSDAVICLSQAWSDAIYSLFPGSNRLVISNGILLPESKKNCEKNAKKTINIIFLGLIGPRKGLFDLLLAFERLVKEKFNIHLSIGGNGQVERLRKHLFSPLLKHTVCYHGWIDETKKDKILTDGDIFVLPSYGEGMPISILEAMSYGLPVVSTCVGAIPEQVEDGVTGYLINPGDIDDLYNKLKKLIINRNLRIEMGQNGRRKIETTFDINKNCQSLCQLYDQLTDNQSQ